MNGVMLNAAEVDGALFPGQMRNNHRELLKICTVVSTDSSCLYERIAM